MSDKKKPVFVFDERSYETGPSALPMRREPLPPKDWALAILRWASVTDWPDPIEYARWVRSVACAGAMGNEAQLLTLEREMQELASGYVRRANDKISEVAGRKEK